MMTRALLLSDEAEADNKPELEIFATTSPAATAATTGALDESLLFYLRARGLSEKEAQASDPGVSSARRSSRSPMTLARTRYNRRRALAGGTGMTMHPAVLNGSYDVAGCGKTFPRSRSRSMANSWSISTTPRPRRAQCGARPHDRGLQDRVRQCASRAALPRQCGDRSL